MFSKFSKASLILAGSVALASVGCIGGLTPATPTPTAKPTTAPTVVPTATPVPPTVLFKATGVTGTTFTGNLTPVAGKQLTVTVAGASISTDQFQITQNATVVVPYVVAPVSFVTTPGSNAVVTYTINQTGTGTYDVVVIQSN